MDPYEEINSTPPQFNAYHPQCGQFVTTNPLLTDLKYTFIQSFKKMTKLLDQILHKHHVVRIP